MFLLAAWDPTFWPLHGSIERMVNRKIIMSNLNEDSAEYAFDTTWGYSNAVNSDYLVGSCDWSNVESATDLTLPTCTMGYGTTMHAQFGMNNY